MRIGSIMIYGNRWIRRRARRLHKACPYIPMRDAILSAIEDFYVAHRSRQSVVN